jgi:hypothetical protein
VAFADFHQLRLVGSKIVSLDLKHGLVIALEGRDDVYFVLAGRSSCGDGAAWDSLTMPQAALSVSSAY